MTKDKAFMTETISFKGLELRFLQQGEETHGRLDLFEMTVEPQARMPIAHHHESWDETIYGLDGVTTWRVDGRDIAVGPGETVFIRRGIVHGFRNDGTAPSKCLCMLTPAALGPSYFRAMAALLSENPPDPAKLKQTMLRYGLIPAPAG
jgi:quercetin dioxygenase-like cupin family protein